MPVQVSYPGVYIEEVSSGVHTITGVSTSIAAFLGRAAKGPVNKAVRCLNYSDFLRVFGGPHPASDLATSVRQFYDNGGTDCYIVRLAHNARAASLTLRNMANTDVLVATAKNAGTWSNNLRLEVNYNTINPDESFNLTVIHEDGGRVVESETFSNLSLNPDSPRFARSFVNQSSQLIDLALPAGFNLPAAAAAAAAGYSESRRPLDSSTIATLRTALNNLIHPAAGTPSSRFEISLNDGAYLPVDLRLDPTWVAFNQANLNTLAGALQQRINLNLPVGVSVTCSLEQVGALNNHVLRITANTAPSNSVRIRRASANDLAAPLMLGLDQGGVEVTRHSVFRPAPTATMLTGDLNTLAALPQNAFNEFTITGNATIDLDASGTNILQTTGAADNWFRDALASAVNGHNDGVREKLNLLARAINAAPPGVVRVRAEVWGYHLALLPQAGTIDSTITFTTGNTGGGGTDIGAAAFATPNVRQYALGNLGNSPFQAGAGQIGRDDDGNPPDTADYIGDPIAHTGLHALDTVDLFNLLLLPGDAELSENDFSNLIGPASIYCQQKRAFFLLDAPPSWTDTSGFPRADATTVNNLRALVVKDHSAVIYPRVYYSDRGLKKLIGPSGMMAGLMARTDSARGVWKAPAGTEADLRGVLDLEVNLTDLENGVLNKLGVNCLRKFPVGMVNWGARTLDGSDDIGSEWKYIPIRRFALFLEESLFRGTKWVVFEPNDEPLWAKIRLNLNAFMMGLFRQGAFQGSTPDKAFFVKCDSETTTQNDRNLGIVNIEVGFAPLKPAEFVIIKIQQIVGDL